MVRTPPARRETLVSKMTADCRYCTVVGYCLLRVLSASAYLPSRFRRKRRFVQPRAVESDAGGNHADGIRHVLRNYLSDAATLESRRSYHITDFSSISRIRNQVVKG